MKLSFISKIYICENDNNCGNLKKIQSFIFRTKVMALKHNYEN